MSEDSWPEDKIPLNNEDVVVKKSSLVRIHSSLIEASGLVSFAIGAVEYYV